jgi:hypothetical protein
MPGDAAVQWLAKVKARNWQYANTDAARRRRSLTGQAVHCGAVFSGILRRFGEPRWRPGASGLA